MSEQFHILLHIIVDDAQPDEMPLLQIRGKALAYACGRPGEPSEALLILAAKPEVAACLDYDATRAFWAALLRRLGIDDVMKLGWGAVTSGRHAGDGDQCEGIHRSGEHTATAWALRES
ncbi:hypothetical protein [Sorangium sp. So ce341]|uniref:hypothetical protein n=1 Tax=Sorangium sp. So ce341 TaxID=3133302 RepID=UPI003F6212E7